jgi:hypothetical protein
VLVAELAPGGVVQRADDREVVTPRGQPRQVLAEANAGDRRRRRAVLAADLGGDVGLRAERLVLRRPAGLEDEDDGLGPRGAARCCGLRLQA